MYHVVSTLFTALVLYLTSYFFYRIGFYSLQVHRKLWNSALVIAFIITALAGVFLALQISHKWNLSFVKTILKWHAEAGIGLAAIGIFHLIWHLSYFKKLFEKQEKIPLGKEGQIPESPKMTANLFVTGFVSSSIQLLLIREMMNISGGYELITGTFLGSWLIGSGIGAAFAGSSSMKDIRKINLVFSLSPFISLSLLFIFANLFLKTGETPSFLISLIFTFIVLIPFCLASGFTFVKLIYAARSGNNFIPGKSFSIETIGGIIAGIIIAFLSSGVLNTYQMILLVIISGFSFVMLTFYLKNKSARLFFKLSILIICSLIIISEPDVSFRQLLLPGIAVRETQDTPYGNITRAEYEGDPAVYYNHRLLSYSDDVMEREEDIHYAMLQSDHPQSVLLISGSINSHINEIMKYPVMKVVYVERDPALIKFENSAPLPEFQNLRIEYEDAFSYIRKSDELFDVIIVLLPPPSSLLLNRFYTTDFFETVINKLNSGGVFLCSPGINTNYFNKEAVNLYSSVFNSLSAVFKNVLPVAGNKIYFIASGKNLSPAFCDLTMRRNISNVYVGPDFLADDLTLMKSEEIISLMDKNISQNRSAHPVACFYYQSFNLSKTLKERIPALILLIIIFILPIFTIRRSNLIMYCSASALAGFEIILLLVLQLTIGNMYQLTGLIIAGLMAGLAVGSGINIRYLNRLSLRLRIIMLFAFYLLSALLINNILFLKGVLPVVSLIILSAFLPALLTGNLFRELTLDNKGNSSPSSVYSADLAGSALGFILFAGLAVPAFGIKVSVFLLSVMVIAGFMFGTVRNKY
ncbi:MAG TPA: hypothetical protein VMW32_06510 [Bacteroidales bacterium]|nr:hypothetical protein [Bacteroidales bacterium]